MVEITMLELRVSTARKPDNLNLEILSLWSDNGFKPN